MFHILDANKNPLPVDPITFHKWKEETREWVVAKDQVADMEISTVFLGLKHGGGMWFETMSFEGDWSGIDCIRYRTWEEAVNGHNEFIENIKSKLSPEKPEIKIDKYLN